MGTATTPPTTLASTLKPSVANATSKEEFEELNCPNGWDLYGSGCYQLFKSASTWEDAEVHCKAEGGFLISVGQQEVNYMNSLNFSKLDIWMGLYDQDSTAEFSYRWSDGTKIWVNGTGPGTTWWNGTSRTTRLEGYMSTIYNASCGSHVVGAGRQHMWYSENCSKALPYICELDKCVSSKGFYCNYNSTAGKEERHLLSLENGKLATFTVVPCSTDENAVGYYCPYENMTSGIECPAGFYCPAGSQADRMPCTPGHKCPSTGMTAMENCKSGNYCPDSEMKFSILCTAGHYCPGENDTSMTACDEGYYCPRDGMAFQEGCTLGDYCPKGSIAPKICEKGSFCPSNYAALPISCPRGYKCPFFGMVSPLDCGSGYFCPEGSVNATECDPGFYCPTNNEANQTSCFHTCDTTGSFTCDVYTGACQCQGLWTGVLCDQNVKISITVASITFILVMYLATACLCCDGIKTLSLALSHYCINPLVQRLKLMMSEHLKNREKELLSKMTLDDLQRIKVLVSDNIQYQPTETPPMSPAASGMSFGLSKPFLASSPHRRGSETNERSRSWGPASARKDVSLDGCSDNVTEEEKMNSSSGHLAVVVNNQPAQFGEEEADNNQRACSKQHSNNEYCKGNLADFLTASLAAAILIQANYRGHRERKYQLERNEAAITLQANLRRHRKRKQQQVSNKRAHQTANLEQRAPASAAAATVIQTWYCGQRERWLLKGISFQGQSRKGHPQQGQKAAELDNSSECQESFLNQKPEDDADSLMEEAHALGLTTLHMESELFEGVQDQLSTELEESGASEGPQQRSELQLDNSDQREPLRLGGGAARLEKEEVQRPPSQGQLIKLFVLSLARAKKAREKFLCTPQRSSPVHGSIATGNRGTATTASLWGTTNFRWLAKKKAKIKHILKISKNLVVICGLVLTGYVVDFSAMLANVILMVKGFKNLAASKESYDNHFASIILEVERFFSFISPRLHVFSTFYAGSIDFFKKADIQYIPFEDTSVTCDGAQAPGKLLGNVMIIIFVTVLFESGAFAFLMLSLKGSIVLVKYWMELNGIPLAVMFLITILFRLFSLCIWYMVQLLTTSLVIKDFFVVSGRHANNMNCGGIDLVFACLSTTAAYLLIIPVMHTICYTFVAGLPEHMNFDCGIEEPKIPRTLKLIFLHPSAWRKRLKYCQMSESQLNSTLAHESAAKYQRSKTMKFHERPSFFEGSMLLSHSFCTCNCLWLVKIYTYCIFWKMKQLVKMTAGVWDRDVIRSFHITKLVNQYSVSLDETNRQKHHYDAIVSTGVSHSIFWQFTPALIVVSKFGEASNDCPLFAHRSAWVNRTILFQGAQQRIWTGYSFKDKVESTLKCLLSCLKSRLLKWLVNMFSFLIMCCFAFKPDPVLLVLFLVVVTPSRVKDALGAVL